MRDILDPSHWWIGTPGGAQIFSNKRPVAVDDTLIVGISSGPVSVDVLANDVDPEGGVLTLVSAFAGLGSAVAEADDTVTYTPPAGVSGFDTVVYEIADDQDQRQTGQINITITDLGSSLAVETQSNSTLAVTADVGPIDVTVSQPAAFAGSYSFDSSDLASGPINLVVPGVEGTLTVGQTLSAAPGLWAYDTTAGALARSYQWLRGGVDISDATTSGHVVLAEDLTPGVSLKETLSDTFGQRSATSAVTNTESFSPLSDPLIVGWWDGADTATITTSGNDVNSWADKAGGGPLEQTSPVRRPASGARTQNGLNLLDFDSSHFLERTQTLPTSGNVAFHGAFIIDTISNAFEALLAIEATADFQFDANNAAQFDGRLNLTGTGTPLALSGGPFSGAFVLSIVFDLTNQTAEVFIGNVSRGQTSYTAAIDTASALHLMTNRSQNAFVDGGICEFIITEDVSNRGDHHAYLTSKWGLV